MRVHPVTERALRLLVYIASAEGAGFVSLSDAAEFSGLFGAELELVADELACAGFLVRRTGFRPALRLACTPERVNLSSVVERLEGPPVPPLDIPTGPSEELLVQLSRTLAWASVEFQNFLAQYSLAQMLPVRTPKPSVPVTPRGEVRRGHLRLVSS